MILAWVLAHFAFVLFILIAADMVFTAVAKKLEWELHRMTCKCSKCEAWQIKQRDAANKLLEQLGKEQWRESKK